MSHKGLEQDRDSILLGWGTNPFGMAVGSPYWTAPNQGQNPIAVFALNQVFLPTDILIKAITVRCVFYPAGATSIRVELSTIIPVLVVPNTFVSFTAGAQTLRLEGLNQVIKQEEGILVRMERFGGAGGTFSCFGSILAEIIN